MSLILDALRKSEAQRRLGEMPTLGTQHGPLLRPRQKTRLGIVLPVLIASVLGGGWLWYDRPDETVTDVAAQDIGAAGPKPAKPASTGPATTGKPRPVASEPRTRSPAAIGGEQVVNGQRVVDGVAVNADGTPVALPDQYTPAEEAVEPPARLDPRERALVSETEEGTLLTVDMAAAAQRGEVFANNPQQLKPFLPTEKRPLDLPDEPLEPTGPIDAGSGGSKGGATALLTDTARLDRPAKPPADAAAVSAQVDQARSAGTGSTSGSNAVPALWELPYAFRKDLPALNITMHYYNEVPEQRFIILNGRRREQGVVMGFGIKLAEITPDGAIFAQNGQSFFIAR